MTTQRQSDLDAVVAAEEKAKQQFIYHINIALQLSEAIHHWGDDDHGYLRELFDEALSKYAQLSDQEKPLIGASIPSQPRQKTYTKSKLSSAKKRAVLERDKYRCINCDDHKDLCVDHIHPEVRGGDNSFDNLQTLCRSCNSSKGKKTMQEWRASK